MGIFSKKKEAEVKAELPPLKFPELPPEEAETSPAEAQEIKKAVLPEKEAAQPAPAEKVSEEKPLFVKIEKYREVMATLNELKNKLKDAGDLLVELNNIKDREEEEIKSWHNDLESIKEKLLMIDKTLFEL